MTRQNGDTSVNVKAATHERLKKYGQFGESYDAMLNRLLDELDTLRAEK